MIYEHQNIFNAKRYLELLRSYKLVNMVSDTRKLEIYTAY